MKHIAIVGAGITGITTAYSLLNRGYSVTVFDRHRYAAMQTSFANGGQLSASNAEVWTQASTILKGLRWMFRRDAPLLVNPTPGWHKYSWMAEFVSNIPKYEQNTIETVRLAIAARKHLFAWADKEKIDFNLQERGILHVYANKQGFDHATRVNKLLASGGLQREAVTAEEMRVIEPTLNGDFYGGYFTGSDSTGDIHKYTRGLADACQRLGCTIAYDAQVEKLEHDGTGVQISYRNGVAPAINTERFDGVVVCAGIASRDFAAQLGDRVNIYPVKGYSVTVELNSDECQNAAPRVSLNDDDAKIVTSRLGQDRFRIAGTAEFNGVNYDIRNDRIEPLTQWCRKLFPAINTDKVIPWAGLRPMMPNMLPRVGAGKLPGVFYNTGHGHLGWTLSAATADVIGETIAAELPVDVPNAAVALSEYRKAS